MAGLPPQPMTLLFDVDIGPGGVRYNTVDLSQCVSLIGRKFHRQGLEWAVAGIRFSSPAGVTVQVATLPQTWSCANAWSTGFRAWRKMNDLAERDMTSSNEAKYIDYKIFFDNRHIDASHAQYAPNLLPQGTLPGAGYVYHWNYSNYDWPDDSDMAGATRAAHMLGDDNGSTSIGLIHNYANLRSRPQAEDPNVPELGDGSVFTSLFDFGGGSDVILRDIAEKNSSPPYWVGEDPSIEEAYPGGKNYRAAWVDWINAETNIYNSGGGANANGFIPGFTALCGLIRFKFASQSGSNLNDLKMWIDLVPGPMNGYMTRPMQDVN